MKNAVAFLLAAFVLSGPVLAATPASLHIGGRAHIDANRRVSQQWPGVYFEGTFTGETLTFNVDDINQYKVHIDGRQRLFLSRESHLQITLKGLGKGSHVLRIEKISESQNQSSIFGTIVADNLKATSPRPRQIEFIGDSFTVGYGNTSPKRECTTDEVWATTDTSQAFGPLTAKAYNADYQINAFSGRGIVRNYDGFKGDTLPVLHTYTLFDGKTEYKDGSWQPQIIVIGLGTNDFSTALKPDEKWKSREKLRDDYRKSYVKFVKILRTKNPKAQFILMASDQMDGEISDQVLQVEKTLESQGETKVDTIIFNGLDYAGCHAHPSVADDLKLKALLTEYINARPELWQGK